MPMCHTMHGYPWLRIIYKVVQSSDRYPYGSRGGHRVLRYGRDLIDGYSVGDVRSFCDRLMYIGLVIRILLSVRDGIHQLQ